MGIKTFHNEPGTVTVPEAYEQLSQEAFAVWLRLHHCTDDQLRSGRANVARTVLKISETRANVLLRELRLKGYIEITGDGPPSPSKIALTRRCKIVGRTRFVTLSRMVSPMAVQTMEPDSADEVQTMDLDSEGSTMLSNHPTNALGAQPRVVNEDDHWLLPVWRDDVPLQRAGKASMSMLSIKRSMGAEHAVGPNPNQSANANGAASGQLEAVKVWRDLAPALAEVMDLFASSAREPIAHTPKVVHKGHGESDDSLSTKRSSLDLSRMKESKERVLAKRGRALDPKHPAAGQPIDWAQIDKTGAPVISFSPKSKVREGMIRVLTTDYRRLRPRERELRTALLHKLRTEFIRIYTRYRRAALLEMNASSTYYEVHANEYKYAEKAATACITKNVTPLQVLRYWHKNIRKFANAKLVVPPLPFLSQPSFIDEVSIAVLAGHEDAIGSGVTADTAKGWKPPKRKTMWLGDTSTLHPRLRRDFMAAGFDVSVYNDSDLCVIQDYAMDVKAGKGIKLYPETLRPMIKWALENTLKDVNPKDTLWRGD
jgi:hypothetical protein